MVAVVPGERHLLPRRVDASGIARRGVGVVVEEEVVLQAVQGDVPDRLGGGRTSPNLLEPGLVQHEVHRLANVDVVQGRRGQVHRHVPDEVSGLDGDGALGRVRLIGPNLLIGRLRWRAGIEDQIAPTGIDGRGRVFTGASGRDLDPIDIGPAKGVGGCVPGRVAHQDDRPPGDEPRGGALL